MTNFPNLPAKDNLMDLNIQLGHVSEGHEDLLIQNRQEWVLDWWGLKENLLGNRLQ
jgi:hypothetical protein